MSRWISVKDRLPEYFIGVLITNGKVITCAELYDEGKYRSEGRMFWVGHEFGGPEWDWNFRNWDITHWMPLPELPS